MLRPFNLQSRMMLQGHPLHITIALRDQVLTAQDRIDLAVWTMKKAGLKPRG